MEGKQYVHNNNERVYNKNRGNPFIPKTTPSCWSVNDLILKDQKLRELSGVSVLDIAVSEVYMVHQDSGNY